MESRFCRLAIEALFPRFCASCASEGSLLCDPCLRQWMPPSPKVACPFCGDLGSSGTCRACQSQTYLDGLTCVSSYGNPVLRSLLQSWKYDGDRSAELPLRLLVHKLRPCLQIPFSSAVAVPVPLHLARERFRGFDQALVVAQWVEETFGFRSSKLLVRSKRTAPQAKTVHRKRQVGTLDGSFRLIDDVEVPDQVVLCDDVFTSGATMDAAARTLKERGVKRVWGFALAQGG